MKTRRIIPMIATIHAGPELYVSASTYSGVSSSPNTSNTVLRNGPALARNTALSRSRSVATSGNGGTLAGWACTKSHIVTK